MSRYKAIIFDCFGVLVEDSLHSFYATYLPDEPEKVEHLQLVDKQASSGEITYDEFVAETARTANIPVEQARTFLDNNPPNESLLDYIATDLKPNYKIGFLSNASDDWMDDLFTPEQQKLFDDVILSFQHGIAKPDIKIFELAANRLGVKPSECIFIDDVADYGTGAKAVCMTFIQYKSFEQVKNDLIEELQ